MGALAALSWYPPRSARWTYRTSRGGLARRHRRCRGNDDSRRGDHGGPHGGVRSDRGVGPRSRGARRCCAGDRRDDDRNGRSAGADFRTPWPHAPRDRPRGLPRFARRRRVPGHTDTRRDRCGRRDRRARARPRAANITRELGGLGMDALALFLVFLKASALSIGGLSSLPLLRAELVAPHIATDDQVIQAIAIGRISTGPNGLYVVSLGYLVAGFVGAGVALVAATLPPLVIVPIATVSRRWLLTTPVAGLVRGVALATAGLLAATSVGILQAAGATAWWQLALAAAGVALSVQGKIHPALIIAIGAAGGILLS